MNKMMSHYQGIQSNVTQG